MAAVTAPAGSAFRSSSFARFYAGQAFSYLGDGLRTLAIPLLVYRLTGSGEAVGLTWGLELLPYALVSLVGGSLADRVDRRRLMIGCDAVRFVVMVLLSVLYATGRLALVEVYGGVLVLAVAGSLFLGSQTPSVRFLLGAAGSKAGVAALAATEQGVNLIAPPLGGALMGLVGPLPALAGNAATYLISQAALATVPTFGPDGERGFPTTREIGADVRAGFAFLFADPALRTLSAFSACGNFVGTIGFVALVPFFKRAFAASDPTVGLAFGAFSAGAALGALIAGRTHWPIGRALLVAYLVDGLGWTPLPWTHALAVAIGGVTLSSVAGGYIVTSVVSWRMRVIPEPLVGRVFGAVRFVVLGGIMPGSILGGLLADRVGVRTTVGISAFGYLAVVALLGLSRAVRIERR